MSHYILIAVLYTGVLIVILGFKYVNEYVETMQQAEKAAGDTELATHAWMAEHPIKGGLVQIIAHAQGYELRAPRPEIRAALAEQRKASR